MDDEHWVDAAGTIVAEWLDTAPGCCRRPSVDVGGSIPSSSEDHLVRTLQADTMSVRTTWNQAAGGVSEAWGKIGDGGEPLDTELSLRLSCGSGRYRFLPDAVVHELVSSHRATVQFFLKRSRAEGRGKARLRQIHTNKHTVLAAERGHLLHDVPVATIRHLGGFLRGDPAVGRVAALYLGFAASALRGFVLNTVRLRWNRRQ